MCRYVDTARSLKAVIRARAPTLHDNKNHVALRHIADYFNVLGTWWSMLYVLIEGYKEMDGNYPKIDGLLEADKVDALRLFRNGMFHFQWEPIHDKLMKFAEIPGVEKWAEELQSAFEGYIEERFPNINGMYERTYDISELPKRAT